MKKALLVLSAILLLCVLLISSDEVKPAALKGKITDFSATDMPFDDGAGIILKWKPLDKSHRVISYNVYRGVSPDSLFLLNSMEVDPKLGVLASELFFYDRGDEPLMEFETAPLRIKKEKQQPADSPLYRKFPQDPKLIGSLIGRYNFTGAIKNGALYKKSIPLKVDDDIMAGLKLYHFEYLFANPVVGQTYYYTVLAVDERGKLLPAADIAKIIPEDNPPDDSATLFSTFVSDTGKANFEWTPPVAVPDIASWEGWFVPKSIVPPEDEPLPETWQTNAVQLFEIPNYYSIGNMYHQVDTRAEGITLPPNMEGYTAVLAYRDYEGQLGASVARHFRIIDSAKLPIMPKVSIEDKKNDKGDYLIASIGKPIAYIIGATYTNNSKKVLRINYELAANEQYKIDKLHFIFIAPDGKQIGEKYEFYVDKSIIFKLPPAYVGLKELDIRIAMETKGSKTYDADYTDQKIVYDPTNKLFKGGELFLKGEATSRQYFDVLSRNHFDPDFMFGNRTNGTARSYDYNIPYEDMLYQPISGYDAQTNRLVLDPRINVDAIVDSGYRFAVPLFKEKFTKQLKQQEDEIAKLKAAIAAFPKGAAPDSLTTDLHDLEGNYKFITNHPAYKAALLAKSDRQWLKTLLKTHAINSRSYAFRLLKTDGNGAFVISDTYVDKSGNKWFIPVSQWIDTTKIMAFIAMMIFCILIVYTIIRTRNHEVYIRPIAGLHEIDNAIGRATEMGRPVMFVPGWGTIGEVDTIASMMILSQIAKKTAEFDIRLISPHCDYMVLPMAQEIVQTAYSEVGRSDAYNQNDIFYVANEQFPFSAGVNGFTVRERVATIIYMGFFNAEALLLTETGNQCGAMQIAGTDAVTQIPFFITTCDYTLIGEEFYAASAYLSRNHELMSMLKAQDYFKLIMVILVVVGTILSTLHITTMINAFPIE